MKKTRGKKSRATVPLSRAGSDLNQKNIYQIRIQSQTGFNLIFASGSESTLKQIILDPMRCN
jgi:hypothetical protein